MKALAYELRLVLCEFFLRLILWIAPVKHPHGLRLVVLIGAYAESVTNKGASKS